MIAVRALPIPEWLIAVVVLLMLFVLILCLYWRNRALDLEERIRRRGG